MNVSLCKYMYIYTYIYRFYPWYVSDPRMVHVSWICQNFYQWHLSLFVQCFLGVSHTHNPQEEIKESFQIAHQGRFAASTAIEEGHMIRKFHHPYVLARHYVPQPCLRLNLKHLSQMLIVCYVLVSQKLQEESLQNPLPTNNLKNKRTWPLYNAF